MANAHGNTIKLALTKGASYAESLAGDPAETKFKTINGSDLAPTLREWVF